MPSPTPHDHMHSHALEAPPHDPMHSHALEAPPCTHDHMYSHALEAPTHDHMYSHALEPPPPCTITIISVDVSVLCQKLDCVLFSVLSEMNPFSLLLKRLDFSISGGDTETALGLERAKNCLLAVLKSGASVHSAL